MRALHRASTRGLVRTLVCAVPLAWTAACASDAATCPMQEATPASASDGGAPDAVGAEASAPAFVVGPHHPLPQLAPGTGLVISEPRLITVTFVGDPNRDQYRAFDAFLPTSKWWRDVTDGYGIGAGTTGTPVELEDALSGKTFDNVRDLRPFLLGAIAQGQLPAPTPNALYMVYLPEGATVVSNGLTLCAGLYGYHDYLRLPEGGYAAYAVIPKCKVGGFSRVSSHEVIEAATDPLFTSYYMYHDAWASQGGAESADLCASAPLYREGGYDLNRSWSNAAVARDSAPCRPADVDTTFFGATVDTNVVLNSGGRYMSDGYLVMDAGTIKEFRVRAFTETPRNGRMKLSVGVRRSANPADVGPITEGVVATLSSPEATNGSELTLNIDVAPTVPPGNYRFTIQAVYDENTYTSMPAILRVR
jgi:hypothetical protein